jgi:hypothetical protein
LTVPGSPSSHRVTKAPTDCARPAGTGRPASWAPDDPSTRRRQLEAALAAGEVDADEAARQLSDLADEQGDESSRRDTARMLRSAATRAYAEAAGILHDAGDELVSSLAAVADECLTRRPRRGDASDRWDQAHNLADLLRRYGLAPTCGASRSEHMYRRPDLAFFWQRENARRVTVRGWEQEGRVALLYRIPHDAPSVLTLAVAVAHREEWGAGLFTATEVAANLAAVSSEERRRMDEAQETAERVAQSRR